MKLTELKCNACNGTLKIDENNPHIAVCEYCKSRYVIEDMGNDNVRLESAVQPIPYVPIAPPKPAKKTGWEYYGWKRGLALFVIFLLLVVAMQGKAIVQRWKDDHAVAAPTSEIGDAPMEQNKKLPEKAVPLTGALAMMAEEVFGHPADQVTDQELAKFQWIKTEYSDGGNVLSVGYSFDNPYSAGNAKLTWLSFSRDAAPLELKGLSRLTGLKKLEVNGYISPDSLEGLSLEGLGCYIETPAELAEILGDKASSLKEIGFNAGLVNLDGLSQFSNVEKLTLYGGHLTDISALASMKQVKSLTLDYCDNITDFSVLSTMTWLEELSIEAEGLKDIGFAAKMPGLTSLSLEGTEILNLKGLEHVTSLTSLSIDRCNEMKECGTVAGLTGLTTLFLDLPYGCEEPDLGSLNLLTDLTLSGFENISFIGSMPGLQVLNLDRCQINNPGVFSNLSNLKELSCSHVYGELSDWNFVSRIPALEVLDISGVSTYEDISGLFLLPAIRELYLNGTECEINFSRIRPNETLTLLEMDGVKLYTNVDISGGGGIMYIDYDKVSLDEHTDFLSNFPNLKSLSLADNTLTQITFAAGLPALETLDISGNYVTDLKPLESLKALKLLDSTGNPVENYRVIGEDVVIVK